MEEKKKRLNINLDELCGALEDGSYEHHYYLDLDTGELVFISEYMDQEEVDKLHDQMDEDPDRYTPLPNVGSDEGYGDMEEFIDTVHDTR